MCTILEKRSGESVDIGSKTGESRTNLVPRVLSPVVGRQERLWGNRKNLNTWIRFPVMALHCFTIENLR